MTSVTPRYIEDETDAVVAYRCVNDALDLFQGAAVVTL